MSVKYTPAEFAVGRSGDSARSETSPSRETTNSRADLPAANAGLIGLDDHYSPVS
jgi:hypothetical protein